ncbi:hypothetical protein [Shewanella indica]|uniref:hypothetical protein n=1 Tax=Shewanella indica TaxID=768528 RepID=UPI002043AD9B|nr:hypothetical protein [Shewanella indica]
MSIKPAYLLIKKLGKLSFLWLTERRTNKRWTRFQHQKIIINIVLKGIIIMIRRSLTVLGVIFFINACANIPLGTMLSLSSFDEQDFAELNPRVIRSQILIDEPGKLKIDATELTLELDTSQGVSRYSFPLKLESIQVIPQNEGLFSSSPAQNHYQLALTDTAINSFQQVQTLINTETPTQYSFSIDAGLDEMSKPVKEITLSVLIKLTEDQGYLTLIDNATLNLEQQP